MRREDLPRYKSPCFVLPKWKIVHISVPKAACTSLKWLLADLQGEDHERFHAALSSEVTRSLTVHRRSRWLHTPMLHELSDDELSKIDVDNGWFIFATVRHPATRLWSAWQSKLLLKDPRFVSRYPEAVWPRVPAESREIVEDFQAFARSIEDPSHTSIFKDRHFRSQSHLLALDHMRYSRIYKTSEIPELLDDLATHCKQFGLQQLPELPRSNETPLKPLRSVFSPDVLEIIGSHYAADFSNFGFSGVLPGGLATDDEYSAEQLADVGRLVERSERIGDLHKIARDLQRERAAVAEQLAAIRAEQRAENARRIRRRIRSAARRLKRRLDVEYRAQVLGPLTSHYRDSPTPVAR